MNEPAPRRRRRRRRRGRGHGPGRPHPPHGFGQARDESSPEGAPRARALPPPEHGIHVGEVGSTWWGERWVRALARFGSRYAARLRRGVIYARQGRVHDLSISRGVMTASVTGSRPTPYRVTLSLRPLPERTWEQAIRFMASKARFSAQLLAGEMPREIDEAFASARASLFPARADDLRTQCSCPDSANPCKHIAALHYVLGEAFDRDPFLLFELRGRSKEAVLAALRALRAAPAAGDAAIDRPTEGAAEPGTLRAANGSAGAAPAAGHDLRDVTPETYETPRQPLGDLHFRIAPPSVEGAIIRQLGAPPGWNLPFPVTAILQAVVSGAATRAREIALEAKPESGARPDDARADAPRERRAAK